MASCLNCEKRSVGCHSSCEDYKKFKKELEEKAKQKIDAKSKESIINSTILTGIRKRYKKYKRKIWW